MTRQHLSIDQMKDSMRAPWIAGDFGALAREIGLPEAERFVAPAGARTWRACAGYRLRHG